jgi:hypothetical protein
LLARMLTIGASQVMGTAFMEYAKKRKPDNRKGTRGNLYRSFTVCAGLLMGLWGFEPRTSGDITRKLHLSFEISKSDIVVLGLAPSSFHCCQSSEEYCSNYQD